MRIEQDASRTHVVGDVAGDITYMHTNSFSGYSSNHLLRSIAPGTQNVGVEKNVTRRFLPDVMRDIADQKRFRFINLSY